MSNSYDVIDIYLDDSWILCEQHGNFPAEETQKERVQHTDYGSGSPCRLCNVSGSYMLAGTQTVASASRNLSMSI